MFEFTFKDNSVEELDRFVEEVLDKIDAKSGTRRKNMFKRAHGTDGASLKMHIASPTVILVIVI